MDRNRPGNIYKMPGKTLFGSHKEGAVYDTDGNKIGFYGNGEVGGADAPGEEYGTYEDGVISNRYGEMGTYKRGQIYNTDKTLIGAYTGDDEGGGAGGGFLLLLGY